jgi:hypothetical protein
MEKRYVKGFILDRDLVAKVAGVKSPNDPEVDEYIRVIIDGLNRCGYKFIGGVYERTRPGQQYDRSTHLAVAIVLDIGHDEEALRRKELEPIDETIAAAKPHVLVGPDVWEFWG